VFSERLGKGPHYNFIGGHLIPKNIVARIHPEARLGVEAEGGMADFPLLRGSRGTSSARHNPSHNDPFPSPAISGILAYVGICFPARRQHRQKNAGCSRRAPRRLAEDVPEYRSSTLC